MWVVRAEVVPPQDTALEVSITLVLAAKAPAEQGK